MAVHGSAAPQPPNRLRPAETNQHIHVYDNTCREQLVKIKPIDYKHVFLDLCFVIYELLESKVIFNNFTSLGAYLNFLIDFGCNRVSPYHGVG